MLREVFLGLKEEMEFFMNSETSSVPQVTLMPISDQSTRDSLTKSSRGGLGLTLVNVEQENLRAKPYPGAPAHVSVNFLVTAFHKNYEESLELLSQAISFFQVNDTITQDNISGLTQQLEMTITMQNNDYVNINSMWKALGADHVPFALYKARVMVYNKQNMNPVGRIGIKSR